MNRGPLGDRHYEGFRKPKKVEQGGLVKLSGGFLLDHGDELVNLIKHQGDLATAKNPEHKVTRIEKVKNGIEVETSDHNLALHIGKSLSAAYKGQHEYKFSADDKYVEVLWQRD
ncbi:MAG: hypothetical protein NT099_05120 [Candidatus Saganbacteria bacterium]|nr:hypothetical protein [Candidatus Saganbacteria bacterium]